MADTDASDVLDLIEDAARRQMARDFDGLERMTQIADQIAARSITAAAVETERALIAAGVDPKLSGTA